MATPIKLLAALALVSALAVPAFASHQLFHFGSTPDERGMFSDGIFLFSGRGLFDNSGPGSFNSGGNMFGSLFFFGDRPRFEDRGFFVFDDRRGRGNDDFFVFGDRSIFGDRGFFAFENRPFAVFGDLPGRRGEFVVFDNRPAGIFGDRPIVFGDVRRNRGVFEDFGDIFED